MSAITLILISLLASAGTGTGGILATLFKPREANLILGLGFSSGIMLGVTFLMLVSESLKAGFFACFTAFTMGSLLFFFLDFIFPHIHIVESRKSLLRLGTLIAIGIAIHDLPEGFAIGSGYAISGSLGMTLAVAIMLHNIPEGIAIAVPFHFSGMSKIKTVFISLAAGISTIVGALLSFFLLASISEKFIYFGLAFAGGAMFYITVNELIPEAHKYGNTHLASFGVLVGILAAFLLAQVGG